MSPEAWRARGPPGNPGPLEGERAASHRRRVNARRARVFPPALVNFRVLSSFWCSRLVGALVLVLVGCQSGPTRPRPLEPVEPFDLEAAGSWLLRSVRPGVEPDLDEVQAATEGARAVLLALPEAERRRVLARWRPAAETSVLSASVPPSDPGPPVASPAQGPREPLDLLSTLRGLYAAQGSRDLALAAFFLGPEPVARVRQKLPRRPPEWLTLERLASRLTRREARSLRYVNEARTRAILYGLTWPVEHRFRVTSGFGPRIHPLLGGASEHRGVDIGVPVGTQVRAPAAGVVVAVRESKVNGQWLEVRHEGGVRTVYCHLSLAEVKTGQKVGVGEVLARSGETGRVTGPHLHYQVKHAGVWVDPVRIRASAQLVAEPLPWESEPLAAPTQTAMP